MVERWFRDLTERALRRGVYHSVPELIGKIVDYIRVSNEDPKPLIWTAAWDSILKKVSRCRVALEAFKKTETLH